MARQPLQRLEPHGTQAAWSASGSINLELSPKPYTITRMAVIVRADITTGATPGTYNDPWDRIISRLALNGGGKTYFDFSNLRAAYHASRFLGGPFAPKRPTVIAASQTNALQQFAYVFHFGTAPFKVNPKTGLVEDNPFDLTGGIPPSTKGNLTLTGAFGAASAAGSGWTINDGDLDVYLWGVQPQDDTAPELWMPRALPAFSMETPTPTAASTVFATRYNVPAGGFLHSVLVMATNGTNSPRDDAVLNSLRVYDSKRHQDVITFGGQSGATADYKAAEILSQLGLAWAPPSDDNSTLGVPSQAAVSDEGLVYLPLHRHAPNTGTPYGLDLRRVDTGDLQLQYGVSDATGVTLDVLLRRYELNPAHPANAGIA